ncbi:MAG: ATP-dependent DNA helicase [Pseudomonadota bacterium]|nr:ATP-dependent DNA helicase [Pseudomonadota bacterium]
MQEFLAEGGPLSRQWPGYRVRPEQIRLAQEVENAMATRVSMALEAPTGTGKTLAYLLPALLAGSKVIISVGNLTLQDHLLLGEYQKLRTLLPDLRRLVVLKGCDNYFCHYRFHQAREGQVSTEAQKTIHRLWHELSIWLLQTRNGEVQSLPMSADTLSELQPWITLGADQCVGRRCPHFEECFFQKARQQAASADLLLINHTLLLSDQRLFDKGMGALLPSTDTVIVDEAHQLPDLLIRRNTHSIDDHAVRRWIKRVRKLIKGHTGLFADLPSAMQRLERMWEQIRQQLLLSDAEAGVKVVSGNSFKPLLRLLQEVNSALWSVHVAAVDVSAELRQLRDWIETLDQSDEDESVLYCDLDQGQLSVVAARLHNPFTSINSQSVSWVFLSATLVVDGGFEYFRRSLSLPSVETHSHQAAMDYSQQAVLLVPADLPLPSQEGFYPLWVQQCVTLLEYLEGGMLMLFSSHGALQEAAALIQNRTDRTVLIYEPGGNRHRLLQRFRQETRSVLLATGSFWEGIDVKGAALSCVAIDKLPFAAPDDVISLAWKYKASQERVSVFNDYMVPHAVTRLRQGVGRLLRSHDDVGLVLLGDNRILKKSYGLRFLHAIPPMPLVQSLAEAQPFLQQQGLWRRGSEA